MDEEKETNLEPEFTSVQLLAINLGFSPLDEEKIQILTDCFTQPDSEGSTSSVKVDKRKLTDSNRNVMHNSLCSPTLAKAILSTSYDLRRSELERIMNSKNQNNIGNVGSKILHVLDHGDWSDRDISRLVSQCCKKMESEHAGQ